MKLTVLDRLTITVGDIDFGPLEQLADVTYYDIVPHEEISAKIGASDAVIVNKAIIDRKIISECPNLKYIGLFATGYNNIDIEAARERGICVCNVPGYSTYSVAQLVFSFILKHATSLDEYNRSTHNGEWIQSYTFSYFPYPISELKDKVLGIVGGGEIGKRVAAIGSAFGMEVIINSRTIPAESEYKYVSKEELFKRADYVTLHCPLTKETQGMVTYDLLKQMKKNAFFINTSRGGAVCEEDLARALNEGLIDGAAVDVLNTEPMSDQCPLIHARNCMITPHIAWASLESRKRLIKLVARNLQLYKNGTPINKVN